MVRKHTTRKEIQHGILRCGNEVFLEQQRERDFFNSDHLPVVTHKSPVKDSVPKLKNRVNYFQQKYQVKHIKKYFRFLYSGDVNCALEAKISLHGTMEKNPELLNPGSP